MKRAALCIAVLLVVSSVAEAQDADIGGTWRFDQRILIDPDKTNKNLPYDTTFSKLRLRMHKDLSDYLAVEVSGEFRLYGQSNFAQPQDLSNPESQFELNSMLWEAYVDVYDIIEGLDMRIGKQRIAWGTADALNPTDNLNPEDLQDPFDFSGRVPTLAVRIMYEPRDEAGVELVWMPAQKAVLLPRHRTLIFSAPELDKALKPLMQQVNSLPLQLEQSEPVVKLSSIPYDLRHSVAALKLKGTLAKVDFSFSYMHGFDDMPIAKRVVVKPSDDFSRIDTEVETGFYEFNVFGADAASELAGIGLRAEAALFVPNQIPTVEVVHPDFRNPTQTVKERIKLFDSPAFWRATLGADYTFKWGTYVNFQYAHGLFAERGDEDFINDYFFVRAEQKFLHDKVKLSLVAAVGVIDWEDPVNNWGGILNPEFLWAPYDTIEFSFGAVFIGAEGKNFFASLEDSDFAYMRVKVDF